MSTTGTYYCGACGAAQPGPHYPGCASIGGFYAAPTPTAAQHERVAAALERIADALENVNGYALMLAAAPAFEPDDAMVERALETFCCVGPTDKHAMRAALKAAFEVKP